MQRNHSGTTQIPYVPHKVDLSDLADNQSLIAPHIQKELANHLDQLKEGRNKKKAIPALIPSVSAIPYDIIKIKKNLYAVYKGKKSQHHLGSGGFATVKLAQDLETGEWVALKINHKKGCFAKLDEIAIQTQYGVHLGTYQRHNKFGMNQQEILMKLARGIELNKLRNDNNPLITIEYLELILLLLQEVEKISQLGIVHRDIKGSNALVDLLNQQLVLIDFGISRFTKDNEYKGGRVGTEIFIPPEITHTNGHHNTYSEKTEIYSIGITFGGILGFKLKAGKYTDKDDQPDDLSGVDLEDRIPSNDTRAVIIKLLNNFIHKNPLKRPDLNGAIKKTQQLISNLSDLEKINLTAYIDMNYFGKNISDQINKWKWNIRPITRIVLTCSGEFDRKKFYEIKRECQSQGAWVSDTVILYQNKINELPKLIQQHHAALGTLKNRVNIATYITNKADHKNLEFIQSLHQLGISETIANKESSFNLPQIAAQYMPISSTIQQLALDTCKNTLSKLKSSKHINSNFAQEISDLESLLTHSPMQYKTLFDRSKKISSDKKADKYKFNKHLVKEVKDETRKLGRFTKR